MHQVQHTPLAHLIRFLHLALTRFLQSSDKRLTRLMPYSHSPVVWFRNPYVHILLVGGVACWTHVYMMQGGVQVRLTWKVCVGVKKRGGTALASVVSRTVISP